MNPDDIPAKGFFVSKEGYIYLDGKLSSSLKINPCIEATKRSIDVKANSSSVINTDIEYDKNKTCNDIKFYVPTDMKKEMVLLKIQMDSLQRQLASINICNFNKTEEEEINSLKSRTIEAIAEADAVLRDMEDADNLTKARAIKTACLAENKRRMIMAQEDVRKRLERIKKINTKKTYRDDKSFIILLAIISFVYLIIILI